MWPFPFSFYIFQRLFFVLSVWPVFVHLWSAFPVKFPILVLIFLSCFFRVSQFSRKLISLQHKLDHLFRLYNSLFFSALTVLYSMFLSNDRVVFSLFVILFKLCRFNFCSCDSVCSELFGCTVFGCVGFPFSEVHFGRAVFVCKYLMCQVLYYYLIGSLFSGVFLLFQGQQTNVSLLLFWLDQQVSY